MQEKNTFFFPFGAIKNIFRLFGVLRVLRLLLGYCHRSCLTLRCRNLFQTLISR